MKIHLEGDIVKKDKERGFNLLKIVPNDGCLDAAVEVELCCKQGRGTERNARETLILLKRLWIADVAGVQSPQLCLQRRNQSVARYREVLEAVHRDIQKSPRAIRWDPVGGRWRDCVGL